MTETKAMATIYLIQSIPVIALTLIALAAYAPVIFAGIALLGAVVAGVVTSMRRREWHAEHIVRSHIGR